MSKVEDFQTPSIGSGILHPAMANRFRIVLDDSRLICQQVTKARVDMLNREITVHIEQPLLLAAEMLNEIYRLCHRSAFPEPGKFPFSVELLDGMHQVHSSVSGFAHVVKHIYDLDYSAAGVAEHILVLRYTRSSQ